MRWHDAPAVRSRRMRTALQHEDGASLESQEAACRAFCAARGLEVVRVFIDGGASGGSIERPALSELRAAVAAGGLSMQNRA